MSYGEVDKVIDFPVKKHPEGRFMVLIIATGRILRWPYSSKSFDPRYQTEAECKLLITGFIKWANKNIKNSLFFKTKRYENEFTIVNMDEDKL